MVGGGRLTRRNGELDLPWCRAPVKPGEDGPLLAHGISVSENPLPPGPRQCDIRAAVTLWVFPNPGSPLERITEERHRR